MGVMTYVGEAGVGWVRINYQPLRITRIGDVDVGLGDNG